MKLLVIALPLTLAASLAWGGTILNTTNNPNPLIAPAATSETIAQLAGMKVVFNLGTSTETAFFNGTTAEAMSTNGFLVLLGTSGNPLQSNVDAATWLVQTGGPSLLGVTIFGAGPGLPGLTAFHTTVEAVCANSAPPLPRPVH